MKIARQCSKPMITGSVRCSNGEDKMKLVLLAGTAFLGLVASGSAARAVPFDFTYTGSLITFTVPTTDNYQILAFGAQGGSANLFGNFAPGGQGAEIGGDFSLTAGETLQIAVGGAGMGGGGGGGSFVVGPGNTPLVIAGAGGGGGGILHAPLPGQGGLTGPDGGAGAIVNGVPNGGTGGNGGGGGPIAGGGGGGGGGFSVPVTTVRALVVVRFQSSPAGLTAGVSAAAGAPPSALVVAAATAAAAAASAASAKVLPVVAAARSMRAQTRSWLLISGRATVRS
jgi:hypothetical protein